MTWLVCMCVCVIALPITGHFVLGSFCLHHNSFFHNVAQHSSSRMSKTYAHRRLRCHRPAGQEPLYLCGWLKTSGGKIQCRFSFAPYKMLLRCWQSLPHHLSPSLGTRVYQEHCRCPVVSVVFGWYRRERRKKKNILLLSLWLLLNGVAYIRNYVNAFVMVMWEWHTVFHATLIIYMNIITSVSTEPTATCEHNENGVGERRNGRFWCTKSRMCVCVCMLPSHICPSRCSPMFNCY